MIECGGMNSRAEHEHLSWTHWDPVWTMMVTRHLSTMCPNDQSFNNDSSKILDDGSVKNPLYVIGQEPVQIIH